MILPLNEDELIIQVHKEAIDLVSYTAINTQTGASRQLCQKSEDDYVPGLDFILTDIYIYDSSMYVAQPAMCIDEERQNFRLVRYDLVEFKPTVIFKTYPTEE